MLTDSHQAHQRLRDGIRDIRTQSLSLSLDKSTGAEIVLCASNPTDTKKVFDAMLDIISQQQEQIHELQSQVSRLGEGFASLNGRINKADDRSRGNELVLWHNQLEVLGAVKNISFNLQGFDDLTIVPTPPNLSTYDSENSSVPITATQLSPAVNDAFGRAQEDYSSTGHHVQRSKKQLDSSTVAVLEKLRLSAFPPEPNKRWKWAVRRILSLNRRKKCKLSLARMKIPVNSAFSERISRLDEESWRLARGLEKLEKLITEPKSSFPVDSSPSPSSLPADSSLIPSSIPADSSLNLSSLPANSLPSLSQLSREVSQQGSSQVPPLRVDDGVDGLSFASPNNMNNPQQLALMDASTITEPLNYTIDHQHLALMDERHDAIQKTVDDVSHQMSSLHLSVSLLQTKIDDIVTNHAKTSRAVEGVTEQLFVANTEQMESIKSIDHSSQKLNDVDGSDALVEYSLHEFATVDNKLKSVAAVLQSLERSTVEFEASIGKIDLDDINAVEPAKLLLLISWDFRHRKERVRFELAKMAIDSNRDRLLKLSKRCEDVTFSLKIDPAMTTELNARMHSLAESAIQFDFWFDIYDRFFVAQIPSLERILALPTLLGTFDQRFQSVETAYDNLTSIMERPVNVNVNVDDEVPRSRDESYPTKIIGLTHQDIESFVEPLVRNMISVYQESETHADFGGGVGKRLKEAASFDPMIVEQLRHDIAQLAKQLDGLHKTKSDNNEVQSLLQLKANNGDLNFKADISMVEAIESSIRSVMVDFGHFKRIQMSQFEDVKCQMQSMLLKTINDAIAKPMLPDSVITTKALCLGCGRESFANTTHQCRARSPELIPKLNRSVAPGEPIFRAGYKMNVSRSLNSPHQVIVADEGLSSDYSVMFDDQTVDTEVDDGARQEKNMFIQVDSHENTPFRQLSRPNTGDPKSLPRPIHRKGFPGKKSLRAEIMFAADKQVPLELSKSLSSVLSAHPIAANSRYR